MSTKKLSSKTIYGKSSWRLDLDQWELANGRLFEKPVVRHPGSVVLVPLRETEQGPEVIMLKQFRHVLNQVIFELPAGTRDWGEDPLECAKRELREETGYQAEKFVHLGDCWPGPGFSDEVMTIYLATHLTHNPLLADIDEEIEIAPILFADLYQQAKSGQIWDAKTVVSVWKTAVYLGVGD